MVELALQTEEVRNTLESLLNSWNRWTKDDLKTLKDTLEVATKENNLPLVGTCHAYLARYYYIHSMLPESMYHLRAGLPIQQANEDNDSLSISYNLLGVDAMNNGNYPLALDYFINTLHCFEEDALQSATAYVNIGHIYYEIGDVERAIEYCQKGRTIFEQAEPTYNLSVAMSQEAIYNSWIGNTEEAWRLILESEKVHTEIFSDRLQKNFMADVHEAKIFYYNAIGDREKRNQHIREFIDCIDVLHDALDFAEDIVWISNLLLNQQDTELVPEVLNVLYDQIIDSDINHIKLQILEAQSQYYELIGEDEKMDKICREYFRISLIKKKEDTTTYRLNVELRNSLEDLRMEQARIENENRRLLQAASTDALTGVANRAMFNQKSQELMEYASENDLQFGIEMLDVDFFKEFNDTYGHQKGDIVLQQIGNLLRQIEDENTFPARYGGDEFVIIYVGLSDEEVLEKANRLKNGIAALNIPHEKSKTADHVTISQGVRNSKVIHGNQVWDFTYTADQALYHVKANGKGKIYLMHHSKEALKDMRQIAEEKKTQ